MADGTIVPNPPRIVEEDGVAGSLLRQAEDGYRASLVEPSAFRRLERRRERRAVWAQGLGVAAAAAAIALIALAARPPAVQRASVERETVERETIRNISVTRAPEVVTQAPSAAALAVPTAPTAAAPSVKRELEAPSEASCSELARARKHDRALTCFRALAQGSGIDAELSLYRAARMFADELGAPERAVALLDDYRAKFPAGAMRAEADWLRVRSLERAKQFERALAESETLLGTPAGRTLAPEIHLLRGRIFEASLKDCSRANSEYVALFADRSPLGDEAEFRRADCLLKLGREDDARAAFQRYLERSAPLREQAAHDRLRELPVASIDPEGKR